MGDRRDPPDTWPPPPPLPAELSPLLPRDPDHGAPRAGVIVHAVDGRVLSATPRALELLGVTLNHLRVEVPRPPVWAFSDAQGKAVDPARLPPFAVVTGGRVVPGGLYGIDDSSTRGKRWVRIECDYVRDEVGRGDLIVTTLDDVTAEQRVLGAYRAIRTMTAAAAGSGRDEAGDLDTLTNSLLATVGRAADADWAVCVRLDRAAGLVRMTHRWSASGKIARAADRGAAIDMFAPLLRQLKRGGPVLVPDMRTLVSSAWVRDRFDAWGLRAGVTAPLMVGGRLDGFLSLAWRRPVKAARELAELVVAAADVLAVARVRNQLEVEASELRQRMADEIAAYSQREQLYDDVTPDLLLEIDEDDRLVEMWLPGDFQSDVLDALKGHNVLEVFAGDDRERLVKVLKAVRAGSPIEVFEFSWMAPNGLRDYESRFTFGDNGRIITVVREVTHRASSPEDAATGEHATFAMVNEELTRLVHERDRFLASVSHELRTPLNAILGLTEMLLDASGEPEPLTTDQRSTLRTIDESGRHLLELINDLLDLSRLRADAVALDLREVVLAEPCRLSFELVRPRALALGVQVRIDNPDPDLRICADERRLRQVLINLMDNAVNYTEPGGTAGLDVRRPDDEHVALSVWDTGNGIAAADHARIFEPFVQLGGRRDGRRVGSGLGLSVVERLVALHDGRIEVDSAPGRGSRFTVVLPVAGPSGRAAEPL